MRTIRGAAIAAFLLLASLPVVASAQGNRQFEDSWFWGAKGGMLFFSTDQVDNARAPLIGAEWLITRKNSALLVGFEQLFFDENSSVPDSRLIGGERVVNIKNMRRASFVALAFPKDYGSRFGLVRPYAGLGMSINIISSSTAEGPAYETAGQQQSVEFQIADESTRASALAMVGAQAEMNRFSVFGQLSMMPSRANFLLNGSATTFLEFGIRYNVGTSIGQVR
jgi:hypothetical protein